MQSKRQSMVESWASTAVGFVLSLGVWAWIVNPLYGLQTSPLDGLGITAIFTVVSIIRGYYMRRAFNLLHSKNKNKNIKEFTHALPTRNTRQSKVGQRHSS